MTLHYQDDWLTVYLGDCREVLSTLPAESVHCVVTSPPYWGLRDYGTATWLGGDEGCDHTLPVSYKSSTLGASTGGRSVETHARSIGAQATPYRHICGKCGATRQDRQLGLEPTPEEYVANMVAVFREVRRVLRRDGTVWLNVGDSYASHDPGGYREGEFLNTDGRPPVKGQARNRAGNYRPGGLKPKDLVGIPWRLAFALQADGWYLRSDIVWAKPNPMPESVTDRPTKAHEYLFLLSREPRYFYDAEAVRESAGENTHPRGKGIGRKNAGTPFGLGIKHNSDYAAAINEVVTARNLRSVWTIATQPYPGAHFATFPQALVEPCVKAGTSERGVCPACGSPWRRVVERGEPEKSGGGNTIGHAEGPMDRNGHGQWDTGAIVTMRSSSTTGWQPTCAHDGEPVPAVVLDPFAGSGTVGLVAQRLRRKAVLVDLSDEYLSQALRRTSRQWGVGGKPERSPKPVPEDSWLAELAG